MKIEKKTQLILGLSTFLLMGILWFAVIEPNVEDAEYWCYGSAAALILIGLYFSLTDGFYRM